MEDQAKTAEYEWTDKDRAEYRKSLRHALARILRNKKNLDDEMRRQLPLMFMCLNELREDFIAYLEA
jgi:hypothetical protein